MTDIILMGVFDFLQKKDMHLNQSIYYEHLGHVVAKG